MPPCLYATHVSAASDEVPRTSPPITKGKWNHVNCNLKDLKQRVKGNRGLIKCYILHIGSALWYTK